MKARISYNVEGHMDGILLTDNDLEIHYWYSAQDIANLLTLHIENGKQTTRNTKKGAGRAKIKILNKDKTRATKQTSRNRLPACKVVKKQVQSKVTRGGSKKIKKAKSK